MFHYSIRTINTNSKSNSKTQNHHQIHKPLEPDGQLICKVKMHDTYENGKKGKRKVNNVVVSICALLTNICIEQ